MKILCHQRKMIYTHVQIHQDLRQWQMFEKENEMNTHNTTALAQVFKQKLNDNPRLIYGNIYKINNHTKT